MDEETLKKWNKLSEKQRESIMRKKSDIFWHSKIWRPTLKIPFMEEKNIFIRVDENQTYTGKDCRVRQAIFKLVRLADGKYEYQLDEIK